MRHPIRADTASPTPQRALRGGQPGPQGQPPTARLASKLTLADRLDSNAGVAAARPAAGS